MRSSICIFFLFFLLPISLFSQQKVIQGAILDYEDGKRIAGATVQNLVTNEIIQTNGMGVFSMAAKEGDSLRISKPEYKEVVTTIYGNSDVIIRLHHSFQLKEVNVYGQSKKEQLNDVMKDFRKKGNYFNGKPPPLAYVFTPISALYGLFGKAPKDARRFQKYMTFELEQSLVDQKFTIAVVESSTGLTGKDLTNFMDIYRPSYQLAEHWNTYDVRSYIKACYEKFEANGRPEPQRLPKVIIPKQEK